MARFDRQIDMALRLIAKNGEHVTWRTIGEPIANVDEPWNPVPAVTEDHDATICFLTVDRIMMETLSFQLGSEIPKGLVFGLMGHVDFEPNLKDVVIRHGKEYRIFNMDILSPNSQIILHEIIFQQ
jgi:hypothetical protein